MKAQDAVYAIVDHFLGKSWYIVDSMGSEQANEVILEELRKQYPAVDETPVDRYRKAHKRCKWCTFCKHVIPVGLVCYPFHECEAKDKIVNPDIPRPFCRMFNLKSYRYKE